MSDSRERHVLAVDDDAAYLSVLKLCMRTCGFGRVSTATDGLDALEQISQTRFDLIVSDWNMQPMDGLELLQAVRRMSWTAWTPFILMTANLTEQAWRQALDLGASDFLVKPFSLLALRAACYLASRPLNFDADNVISLRPRLAQRRMERRFALSSLPALSVAARPPLQRQEKAEGQISASDGGASLRWRHALDRIRRLFHPAS